MELSLFLTFCSIDKVFLPPMVNASIHLLNLYPLPSTLVISVQCQAEVVEELHKGQLLSSIGNISTNPASQSGVCHLRPTLGPWHVHVQMCFLSSTLFLERRSTVYNLLVVHYQEKVKKLFPYSFWNILGHHWPSYVVVWELYYVAP